MQNNRKEFEISYEKNKIKNLKQKGECLLYKVIEEKDTKNLNQIEIDNMIDESINLSIIFDLLNLNLITEKQFYMLKEKIKCFY